MILVHTKNTCYGGHELQDAEMNITLFKRHIFPPRLCHWPWVDLFDLPALFLFQFTCAVPRWWMHSPYLREIL